MTFERTRSVLIGFGLIACATATLADTPAVKNVDDKSRLLAFAGISPRPAVVTDIHTAFNEGDRVGALHSGAACDAKADREWSDLIRQRVEADLPRVFEEEMGKAGGTAVGLAAQAAPLRVQAFLNNLDIEVCQASAGAWQGGFYVQVGWQVVSPDTGHVVYQASTEGSFMLNAPQRMATAAGLREAFAVSVRNLLSDRRFASALQGAEQRRVAQSY